MANVDLALCSVRDCIIFENYPLTKLMNAVTIIVIILLTVVTPPVTAANCFGNSPGKNQGVPLTAELEIKDLSHTEYNQISRLISFMSGFWNGAVTEITCKGDIAAVVEEKQEYKARARGKTNYMPVEDTLELLFKSRWEGRTRNVTRPENFRLLLTRERLRLSRNIPAGDVVTVKVLDNFLVIHSKTNVRNRSGGVVAQEIVRSFLLEHNVLKIEYQSFSNGRLVSESQWELKR